MLLLLPISRNSVYSLENGSEIIIVQLRASDQGRDIVKKYLDEHQREMQYESPTIMLSILIKRLGKYEKSLHYFERPRDNP